MTGWIDQIVEERRHDWSKDGVMEGFMEGFIQGFKEGFQEGIREGAASLAVRMLARKFGSLDADLEKRVRQLSPEQLGRLGEEMLGLSEEASLAHWLDTIGKPRQAGLR
ncbi:MAG: DUF4351 domain-containing protein [Thermodesulfobacteriota bacterium]